LTKGSTTSAQPKDIAPEVQRWINNYGEETVFKAWKAAEDEARYVGYEPNPKIRHYHDLVDCKIVTIKGGNRSGKTFAAIHDLVGHCTNVWPHSLRHLTKERWRPIKAWVITMDYPTLREAIDEYIQKFVPEHWIAKWNANQHILIFNNLMDPSQPGSIVSFRSADAGASKMESAAVDYVLFDEEPSWAVFHAVYTRTVSTKGIIRIAMTPTNGYSWSYKKLFCKRHQFDWISFIETTMYDNPHLDPTEIQMAEEMYDDDVVRAVRILGNYAELAGEMVFSAIGLARLRQTVLAPIVSGPSLDVWKKPVPGEIYVIGGDVAGGTPDGDWSTAVALNRRTWSVDALLRRRCQPDEFADDLMSLGKAYNNAQLAVERQNHGTSTLICLRDRGYFNLFCHGTEDRINPWTPSNLLGWDTNVRTKEEAINHLREMIGTKRRSAKIRVPSETILDELGSYIYYTNQIPEGRSTHKSIGRVGAKYGCYDDTVMALAIAAKVASRIAIYDPSKRAPEETPGTYAHLLHGLETDWNRKQEAKAGGKLEVVGDHLEV
jgi:phage terminase large subunit-like protein